MPSPALGRRLLLQADDSLFLCSLSATCRTTLVDFFCSGVIQGEVSRLEIAKIIQLKSGDKHVDRR